MINIESLKKYLKELKLLKNKINKEQSKTGQIHKNAILLSTDLLSDRWFNEIKPILSKMGFTNKQLIGYDEKFTHLLKLSSSKGNKKNSFLLDLRFIVKSFTDDIILKIQTRNKSLDPLNNIYDSLLETIQDEKQNKYLKEAIDCAKDKYLRAAIVLGWCACIDQIHKKINQLGFLKFNITSIEIANVKTGRFKKYNKVFNISSLNDLKTVFDNDILWIIEGMCLVDLNQHTRLKSCFDMRNHCAHPGEAPITPYNVMSFFSDINEIIFKNPNFKIE